MIQVRVVYAPALYGEVLASALERTGSIEVTTDPDVAVDAVIFPLNDNDRSQVCLTPELPRDIKLNAASASGDRALIWLPDKGEWEEIRPFELGELIREVLAGRNARRHGSTTILPPMK